MNETARIGIIAAVSTNGVIGRGGGIPWDEPADRRRFKAVTWGSTLIMGRRTYVSLPGPLPGRTTFVLSRTPISGVATFSSLDAALEATSGPVWIIGGAQAYREGLQIADVIDLTRVPVHVDGDTLVYFPDIDPSVWRLVERGPHPDAAHLEVLRYVANRPSPAS